MGTVSSARMRYFLLPSGTLLIILSLVPWGECAQECRPKHANLGEDALHPGNLTRKLVEEFEKVLSCPNGTELIRLDSGEFCVDVGKCSSKYSNMLSKVNPPSEFEYGIVYNNLLRSFLESRILQGGPLKALHKNATRAIQLSSALIRAAEPWFYLNSLQRYKRPKILFQSLTTTLAMPEVQDAVARRCPEMLEQPFYRECLALNRTDCEPDLSQGFRFRFELCMAFAFKARMPEFENLQSYVGESQANAINASIVRRAILTHFSRRYLASLPIDEDWRTTFSRSFKDTSEGNDDERRLEGFVVEMSHFMDRSKYEKDYSALLSRANKYVNDAARIITRKTIELRDSGDTSGDENPNQFKRRSTDSLLHVFSVCFLANWDVCPSLMSAIKLDQVLVVFEKNPRIHACSSEPQQPFRCFFRAFNKVCGVSCDFRLVARVFMMIRQNIHPISTALWTRSEDELPEECLPI